MLGAASGTVSGLVAITPVCGTVGVGGALAIGALGGIAGFWGVNALKHRPRADDSLDVFGLRVHHDAEREGLDISSHGESPYEL